MPLFTALALAFTLANVILINKEKPNRKYPIKAKKQRTNEEIKEENQKANASEQSQGKEEIQLEALILPPAATLLDCQAADSESDSEAPSLSFTQASSHDGLIDSVPSAGECSISSYHSINQTNQSQLNEFNPVTEGIEEHFALGNSSEFCVFSSLESPATASDSSENELSPTLKSCILSIAMETESESESNEEEEKNSMKRSHKHKGARSPRTPPMKTLNREAHSHSFSHSEVMSRSTSNGNVKRSVSFSAAVQIHFI
jgi:hypothetical protein